MRAEKFWDRFILVAGGAATLFGGLLTVVPTLIPQWVAWVCAGVGALIAAFGLYRVREDCWEWLLKQAVERQQNTQKLEDDPLDIVLAKRDLSDFIEASLKPAYNAIYEAVRVAAYVYQANWKDNDSNQIAFWGIQSRLPDNSRIHILIDKEKIRRTKLEHLQDTVVEALARYRASCEMLNLVCEAMNRTGRHEDKRNYTQKESKKFHVLVSEWWAIHNTLKSELQKLSIKSDFAKLKYYVSDQKVLDRPSISDRVFTTFIQHYEGPKNLT